MKNKTIIQPRDLYKLLKIKEEDYKLADQILSNAFAFLVYMKEGDVFETSDVTFSKLSHDLIYMNAEIDSEIMTNELKNKRVIKLLG